MKRVADALMKAVDVAVNGGTAEEGSWKKAMQRVEDLADALQDVVDRAQGLSDSLDELNAVLEEGL